jgi:hypothetical protein
VTDPAPSGGGPPREPPDRLAQALDMLQVNGYLPLDVHVSEGVAEVTAEWIDDFGSPTCYVFGLAPGELTPGLVEQWRIVATRHRAHLICVADDGPDELARISWASFVARLGGPIPSLLALDPAYGAHLVSLGHNQQPADLSVQSPSDEYEAFVGAGLGFLLGSKVVRYGATRRFEAVPDGLLVPFGERVTFLYDAKAYDPSFSVERDDLRRFADYVVRFNDKYGQHGAVRSFLVVSSTFGQGVAARRRQSDQLQADSGASLAFLTSAELAKIVTVLLANPWARMSIRWSRLFALLDVTAEAVEAHLAEIDRDGMNR